MSPPLLFIFDWKQNVYIENSVMACNMVLAASSITVPLLDEYAVIEQTLLVVWLDLSYLIRRRSQNRIKVGACFFRW